MKKRPATIICDIDGTLIHHYGSLEGQLLEEVKILPNVKEKLEEWDRKGYRIILITGRRESSRSVTEKQLESVGIFYDMLIMGVGGGPRILINDLKPERAWDTAEAYNVVRNTGLGGVNA
jgi:FMN phosphatase YigB (HAD superfamily)